MSDDFRLNETVLVHGHRIACARHGPVEGKPVVLVHGTPSHSFLWRGIVPVLVEGGFRVHFYDLLGFGASERPLATDTSVTEQEAVLLALFDHWSLLAAHVVAHDIGGAIGLRLAVHTPARLLSLTVIDTCSYDSWPSPTWTAIRDRVSAGGAVMDEDTFGTMMTTQLRSAVHRPGSMAGNVLDAYLAPFAGAVGRASYFEHQMAHFDSRHTEEISARLGEIGMPVHIVWGAEDRWQPVTWAYRLAGDIGHARTTIIPDAGHFVMEDAPKAVAAAIVSFLDAPTAEGAEP